MPHRAFPGVLCVIAVCAGCGDDVPPPIVPPLEPVTGVVTIDDQPAAGVTVTFTPISGTGEGAFALTDATGTYKLIYVSGDEGVPAGDYNVLFSKFVKPDGSPIAPGEMAADVGAVNALPARYMQPNPMGNHAQVVPGGGKFDFKLQSK